MTRKFAVNVMGYVLDELDKYEAEDINGLLDRQTVTECFRPFKIVSVAVKELPADGPVIPIKDVKQRDKFSLRKKKRNS
jgi:hypothetical protein